MPSPDHAPQIMKDAEEFGVHSRAGGWRLGLLVARSVEKGTGTGGNPSVARATDGGKVSARAFAETAGTSPDRVLRHLDAWELAAEAGLVRYAADLAPGDDPPLPDPGKWSDFYPPHALSRFGPERQDAIKEQAELNGISANSIAQVLGTPKAVLAAITADQSLADKIVHDSAAHSAVIEAQSRRYEERSERLSPVRVDSITDEDVIRHGRYILAALIAREDGTYTPGPVAALILASVRPVVDWDDELAALSREH
jgi:hypothetical protein